MFYFSATIASISTNMNKVQVLNGINFKDWNENMEIVLGCMDLDLALRMNQHPSPMEFGTSEQRKDYEKWDRSNRMSHGLVCSEVNLALVPGNTWWLEFGATTDISVSMKGCLNY